MSRSVATVVLGNLFPPAVSVLTGPILAQALGLGGRGVVAAATAPFALVTAVVTLGLPDAVTFAIARSPGAFARVLRRGVVLLLLAGVVAVASIVVASPVLSGHDAEVRRLMLLASVAIVPNMCVGALRGAASALRLWHLVTAERITSSVLKLALLVPFWLSGRLTPIVAVVILSALPTLGAAPYLALLRRRPPPDDVAAAEPLRAGDLLSFGIRVWAGSISGILLMRVDQAIITPLSSSDELALYVVAVSISELPLIVNSAVRDVTFVNEVSGSQDARVAVSARISTFLCLLVGAVLGVTMVWWLPMLFGADFRDAVPVAALLLVAVVGGTPGSIAGSALSGRGRPGLRSWSLTVACAVNVALLFVLVPLWGAMGAAAATLVGNLVSSNMNIVFAHRYFELNPWSFYGLRRGDLALLSGAVRRLARRTEAPAGR